VKQRAIYLIENKKTRERIWALDIRGLKGWRVIDKRAYTFQQEGVC